VEPASVVPTLDVVEDSSLQTGTRGPGSGVDELSLDVGEKAFRRVAGGNPGHAGDESGRL